jgi:hypothetical protein
MGKSVVAVLIFAAACQQPAPEVGSGSAPILGGTQASVGQYPTVVAVLNNGLCTGTLIDRQWVLTAAHCIHPQVLGGTQEQITANTTVLLDSTNVFQGGTAQIGAAETIPHPGFSLSGLGDDDIGLIRLQTAVTNREPSPINRINADAPAGVHVTQVGFGVTDPDVQDSAGRLYVLADKASRSCQGFEGSNANLLCFGQTDGTGKCEGDSGGPSFATIGGVQRVVGVTSFGDQNCAQFGADTRVDAELDFLFQHVPALECQADGACAESCGTGSLPEDPDCPTCEGNDDCADQEICQGGRCMAEPFSPGGLGSECTSSTDCDSGLCASNGGEQECTAGCDPAASTCPDGFDCIEAGSAGICWAAEGGGGCRSSRGGAGAGWLTLLAALALARRRRHQRAARS